MLVGVGRAPCHLHHCRVPSSDTRPRHRAAQVISVETIPYTPETEHLYRSLAIQSVCSPASGCRQSALPVPPPPGRA